MFLKQSNSSIVGTQKILLHVWDDLDKLHDELKKLQDEVNDDDLEMTISLIEGKLPLSDTENKILIQFLSVVLMEVSVFLKENIIEQPPQLSIGGVEILDNILIILGRFRTAVIAMSTTTR